MIIKINQRSSDEIIGQSSHSQPALISDQTVKIGFACNFNVLSNFPFSARYRYEVSTATGNRGLQQDSL